MNLIGPVSLSEHYNGKLNKHIYIFGDEHIIEAKCNTKKNEIDISTFLADLVSTNEKSKYPIDIYLESQYKLKGKEYQSNIIPHWINRIENRFFNCLQSDKSKCEYKNTRFHYSDLRPTYFYNFISYYDLIYNIYIFSLRKDQIRIPKNLNIIKNHYNLTPEELEKSNLNTPLNSFGVFKYRYDLVPWKNLEDLMKNNNDKIASILKISKQFDNVKNKEVIEYYENTLKKKLYKCIDSIRDNLSFIKSFIYLKIGDIQNNLTIYKNFLYNVEFLTSIFDSYLLGRMFRTFQNSPDPQKIILYVGEAHAEKYREILRKLNFTFKESKSKRYGYDFQCINLSSFHLPFFDKKYVEKESIKRFCGYMSKENFDLLSENSKIVLREIAEYLQKESKGDKNRIKKVLSFYLK